MDVLQSYLGFSQETAQTMELVANAAQIVGILLALAGLWVAFGQLKDAAVSSKKTERTSFAQLILMLDDALRQYDDVRTDINYRRDTDYIRLRRYLAIFERIACYLNGIGYRSRPWISSMAAASPDYSSIE